MRLVKVVNNFVRRGKEKMRRNQRLGLYLNTFRITIVERKAI